MNLEELKINIIGSGISGLIAAIVLEKEGFKPVVWEKSDRVGGRVKTDLIDGYQLDHGFQVLLDHYPKAKEYLDYKSLELQSFLSGAIIYNSDQSSKWGDPLKSSAFLFSPFKTNIASIGDNIKLLKHTQMLKSKSLDEIFDEKEQSTLSYLKSIGFSEKIISRFFKPFFAGIFLEDQLNTSSRMFNFVLKMFSEGKAVVPRGGMESISQSLLNSLKQTTFHYGVEINEVKEGKIIIEGVDNIDSDYIIVATEADRLISNLKGQGVNWKSCHNFYFEVEKPAFKQAIIGLQSAENKLINNFHFPQQLNPKSRGKLELLSITVVNDQNLSLDDLLKKVESEIKNDLKLHPLRLIKHYSIPKALPELENIKHDIAYTATQLTPNVFLAGDQLLNGSLNAAMTSGERAAQAVIHRVKGLDH